MRAFVVNYQTLLLHSCHSYIIITSDDTANIYEDGQYFIQDTLLFSSRDVKCATISLAMMYDDSFLTKYVCRAWPFFVRVTAAS